MYSRYKTSILNPSRIPLLLDKKILSILYFLILGLIYILPNLVYVISTGGIDNYFFVEIVDEMRNEDIDYTLSDNVLTSISNDPEIQSIVTNSLQITFVPTKDEQLATELSVVYQEVNKLSETPIKLIFTEKRIIGLFSFQGFLIDLDLGTYQEFSVGEVHLENTTSEVELNNFSRVLHNIHNKYKSLIVMVTIPSLLIAGFIGLALTLLIPSFVLFIFNSGLGVKFGKIYHMSIYAFTIYILGSTLLYMFVSSYITLILEIVSFFYLSAAMRAYAFTNKGGFKREL